MRCFSPVVFCLTVFSAWIISPVTAQTQVEEQPASVADSTIHPELWPKSSSPIPVDPALEERIGDLISKMTLRQKVGQIIQADIGSIKPQDLKKYPLGSILNGGNSAPDGNNRSKPEAWLELADKFYDATKECDLQGGPYIPILWGTDAVHGHSNIVGATTTLVLAVPATQNCWARSVRSQLWKHVSLDWSGRSLQRSPSYVTIAGEELTKVTPSHQKSQLVTPVN